MTWNVDEFQMWVTLVAAVLAAVTSGLNLWWKFREKAIACFDLDESWHQP